MQALHAGFHLPLHRACNAPLPVPRRTRLSFGSRLEPPSIIGARTHRPVSCYALFKWWLLLSQHPGCLGTLTSFDTELIFRGLSGRSGLFPSRQRSLSPAVSLPSSDVDAIRSLIDFGNPGRPLGHSVLYLRYKTDEAAPQCISGRTSYLCVRLAFHQTTHSSSEPSSTDTGPGVHRFLHPLPPGHG